MVYYCYCFQTENARQKEIKNVCYLPKIDLSQFKDKRCGETDRLTDFEVMSKLHNFTSSFELIQKNFVLFVLASKM